MEYRNKLLAREAKDQREVVAKCRAQHKNIATQIAGEILLITRNGSAILGKFNDLRGISQLLYTSIYVTNSQLFQISLGQKLFNSKYFNVD